MKLEVRIATELILVDHSLSDKYYQTLFRSELRMKVYAKGCDAPGCSQEAEVDSNLGRPADWYFVTVDGGAIPQGLRRTLIVCQKCYRNSGVEDLASGLILGAAARAAGVVT